MTSALTSAHPAVTTYIATWKPRGRLSPAQWTAVGVSVAIHLGIGAYLYGARYTVESRSYAEQPPAILTFWDRRAPVPPPPPPRERVQRTAATPVHRAAELAVRAPQDSPISVPPTNNIADFSQLPSLPGGDVGDGGGSIVTQEPPHIISQPHWVGLPSAAQMARFYPDRAIRQNVSGRATLNCSVNATGRLSGCAVGSETPADMGFGSAALRLSAFFRMSPRTVNGQPVDGSEVSIPITFSLPN